MLPYRQLPACCHNLGKPNLFSQASIEKASSTCNLPKIDPEDPSSVITHGLKKITCSQVPSPDITARNLLFDKNDMSRMPHGHFQYLDHEVHSGSSSPSQETPRKTSTLHTTKPMSHTKSTCSNDKFDSYCRQLVSEQCSMHNDKINSKNFTSSCY
jgi:hypothetical protein